MRADGQTGGGVFVAGHRGLAGSAIVRALERAGRGAEVIAVERRDLDLRDPVAVGRLFAARRPREVYVAAGTVGGIQANIDRPAEFLRDNLLIAANAIHAAHEHGVERLLYLGSSCIYPRLCPQPMREEHLLTGPLEPTNEAYALAKIAGVKLCEAYRRQHGRRYVAVMPANLYGPGDNFDPGEAHVVAALIRRFHEARERGEAVVTVWGTGTPRRELLYVDDLAEACLTAMERYDEAAPLNVGTGVDLSVRELAERIRDLVHPAAALRFDTSRPDGAPAKRLEVSRLLALGWRPRTALDEGLRASYRAFLDGRA